MRDALKFPYLVFKVADFFPQALNAGILEDRSFLQLGIEVLQGSIFILQFLNEVIYAAIKVFGIYLVHNLVYLSVEGIPVPAIQVCDSHTFFLCDVQFCEDAFIFFIGNRLKKGSSVCHL